MDLIGKPTVWTLLDAGLSQFGGKTGSMHQSRMFLLQEAHGACARERRVASRTVPEPLFGFAEIPRCGVGLVKLVSR